MLLDTLEDIGVVTAGEPGKSREVTAKSSRETLLLYTEREKLAATSSHRSPIASKLHRVFSHTRP